MTKKDLNIIDNLLDRLNNLPKILHLRASEIGYKLTEEDKELLKDTYQKLDDILKEVAAFINVKFPGRQGFIQHWNEINFDTKIGDFKIITTDREHIKREWRNGIFDLKSLIKSMRNEIILMIDDEDEKTIDSKSIDSKVFSGNIIYNENKVTGDQFQSSSKKKTTKQTAKDEKNTIKKIFISIIISVFCGFLVWYLTTYIF
ncbi:hypothetical protein SAMN06265371_106239 [Lutibacter agarilyticus]|uniref:Uncharacterized protein n=1 Tax=Lutibacter agarilyticus TaxID=1109740 RepID=A0A238XS02_9FLAO|nr:hypothetical protein [Lutibacter agarilyticus]SNR61104.1 hypothetical protein SAMN06265371_106239 [Lutibacter agarilyticus]